MPTKEQFLAYRKVQESGKYNMLMDAEAAAAEAGLDMKTYRLVILNYEGLRLKYA